jgi:hypothetical protein
MHQSQPEETAAGLPVDDALAILAYLVTSADLCTHEPWHYGMFRLTDGAGRLANALVRSGAAGDRPWLAELHRTIEAKKELMMWDMPAFEQLLHDNAKTVAAHLRREAEEADRG